MENMLYGSALRSEYPRAEILSIDTSEAEKINGVACVMTAKDIPGAQKVGHLKRDWDVLIPVGNDALSRRRNRAYSCGNSRNTGNRQKSRKGTIQTLAGGFFTRRSNG